MSTIKVRRGTAAQWSSANPVLASGEQGFDTTNQVLKIGDGVTAWSSLGAANSGTYAPLGAHAAGPLVEKLRAGVEDANLTVVGDSTGSNSQTNSWGPRLAAWLAAQFPAYTVIRYEWTVGSGYDGGTTVQTGSGAQTLKFYNGSASGQSVQYSVTNLTTLIPAEPDLVILNHGHNNGEAVAPNPPSQPGFRAIYLTLLSPIRAKYPRAGIILTAQNPETSPVAAGTISLHKQHARIIGQLAATEGCGLVDVMSAFLTSSTALASLVGSSDGIHPTSAGYDLWLATVQAEIPVGSKALSRPKGTTRSVESVFLPAPSFGLTQGTPSLTYASEDSFFNRQFSSWAFGDAAVHAVGGGVQIPSHWETINITLLWTATSITGNVVWSLAVRAVDIAGAANNVTGGAKNLLGLTATTYPGGNFTVAAPSVAQTITATNLFSGYTISGSLRSWLLNLKRVGDNGSDTMTGNAEMLGLLIERVS